MEDLQAESGAEHRAARRTNLMLSATVESGGRSRPVRIRNLSETGALIEGGFLPEAGAPMVLSRGDLHIAATIAWAAGEKRGVRFDAPTPVHEWTGGKPRPLDCTGLRDQRRVDAIQAEARGGGATETSDPGSSGHPAAPGCEHLDVRLADELAYVQRLLDGLGDDLILEPIVVQRHTRALQGIDLASQILAHIAAVITAPDRAAAVERIGMDDLRSRLRRRPLV